MMLRLSGVLLLLSACTEYDLTPKPDDGLGGGDSGLDGDDSDTVEVDACADPVEPSAESVALNEECETEFQTRTFTPTIEWSYGNVDFCGPAQLLPFGCHCVRCGSGESGFNSIDR